MARNIHSLDVRSVKLDTKRLSERTRRFIDPRDEWYEMSILFNLPEKGEEYRTFMINWLIMGIDSQTDVKCLVPIEETIRYTALTHGGASTVHGSNMSIYDGLQLLPIDQRLELGTKFSLRVPISDKPYARAVFSESIEPMSGAKKPMDFIPFNRRNYLLCIEPGESLSMQLQVGYANNFSIRERTYWWPEFDDPSAVCEAGGDDEKEPFDPLEHHKLVGITVGTQLSRSPVAYMQTIVGQLQRHMAAIENNRLAKMMLKSGLPPSQHLEPLSNYLKEVHSEILALSVATT